MKCSSQKRTIILSKMVWSIYTVMIFKSLYGNKQTCKVIKMWELSVQIIWWNIQVKRAVTHLNQRLSMACNCSSHLIYEQWTKNCKSLSECFTTNVLFTVRVAIHVGWLVGGEVSLDTCPNDDSGQVWFKLAKCFHERISSNNCLCN